MATTTKATLERLIEWGQDPDQKVDGTFTLGELHTAFDLVKPAQNWKERIDATVTVRDDRTLEAILRAIPFFTGSKPNVRHVGRYRYRFQAAGYYAAVGA